MKRDTHRVQVVFVNDGQTFIGGFHTNESASFHEISRLLSDRRVFEELGSQDLACG
jgi:hypothetical protein